MNLFAFFIILGGSYVFFLTHIPGTAQPQDFALAAAPVCLVLFAMHFVRIFDNSFWGDEGFSIGLAQMNVFEMLQVTAQITIRRCTIFSRNSYIIFWAITDMSIICRL